MSTLIGSLSELVALLVQSFNLSAVFPAFAFVLLNYLFALPMLRDTAVYASLARTSEPIQVVVLGVATVGLAYLLTAMNRVIIRVFEGYPLKDQFPFNRYQKRNLERPDRLQKNIAHLRGEIARIEREALKTPISKRAPLRRQQRELMADVQAMVGELFFMYPVSRWRILPTRLGNIIAAAEDYPAQLFGMDTVVLWPYLVPTLVESGYSKFIEREKAIFDLLLNTTALVAVLGVEIGLLDAFLMGFTWRLPAELLLLSGAVAVLYYLTSQGAIGWGGTIRTAFVLYRHKLRASLGLARPESYMEERDQWILASDFYRDPSRAKKTGQDTRLFDYKLLSKDDSDSAKQQEKQKE